MEYVIDENNTAKSIYYVRAKGYSPDMQVTVSNDGTTGYTYLLQDHLGSALMTVDAAGNTRAQARFDPWGSKVFATGTAKKQTQDDEKTRGYTGHELIASANMGHWNGRVFDYEIGAFPSPDIFIQGRSIAALNRFALGHHNNPNVMDWSGWFSFEVLDHAHRSNRFENPTEASNAAQRAFNDTRAQRSHTKVDDRDIWRRVLGEQVFNSAVAKELELTRDRYNSIAAQRQLEADRRSMARQVPQAVVGDPWAQMREPLIRSAEDAAFEADLARALAESLAESRRLEKKKSATRIQSFRRGAAIRRKYPDIKDALKSIHGNAFNQLDPNVYRVSRGNGEYADLRRLAAEQHLSSHRNVIVNAVPQVRRFGPQLALEAQGITTEMLIDEYFNRVVNGAL